jgi:Ran GTPase-activating protein (RanGAP) involved in mRNA processing and transport
MYSSAFNYIETLDMYSSTTQTFKASTTAIASQVTPNLSDLFEAPFVVALEAVPAEDWCRTWPAERTIMLRRTSKRVKEAVDKMRLPVVVRLNRSFLDKDNISNDTVDIHQFVISQLNRMSIQFCITTLDLSVCYRRQKVDNLPQCPSLANLNLARNNIGPEGAEILARVLGQCTALTDLNLATNNIGPEGAEILARVLPQCPSLTYLNLANNKIGPEGAEILARVLGQCKAMTYLNLANNKIGLKGVEMLAPVLPQCPSLNKLYFELNNIGPEGAEILAGVLGQCKAMTSLKLGSNEIVNGAISITGNLPQTLTELDLSDNYINCTIDIARNLPQCVALTHLDLSCNSIRNIGAANIAKVLKQCTSLISLNINYNEISESIADSLSYIRRKETLEPEILDVAFY